MWFIKAVSEVIPESSTADVVRMVWLNFAITGHAEGMWFAMYNGPQPLEGGGGGSGCWGWGLPLRIFGVIPSPLR